MEVYYEFQTISLCVSVYSETYGHKSIRRNVTDEEERFKSSLIVRPLSNILLCCVNECKNFHFPRAFFSCITCVSICMQTKGLQIVLENVKRNNEGTVHSFCETC